MSFDPGAVEVLLCDADGNLFPSEEPAFVASAAVTNRLLAEIGVQTRYAPDELRRAALGRNFRSTAVELAARHGVQLGETVLEHYVAAEKRATGLAQLFPPVVRFSAEDSLPAPASKPDPAVYLFAAERLGVSGARGLAVEDAVAGVLSAVAAGVPVIGNLAFVPEAERPARAVGLLAAGAAAVVDSWTQLCELLGVRSLAPRAA
jgi:hypothetical protein